MSLIRYYCDIFISEICFHLQYYYKYGLVDNEDKTNFFIIKMRRLAIFVIASVTSTLADK